MQLVNAATNFELLDIYVVDAGSDIEDETPRDSLMPTGSAAAAINLPAGSFDLYVTAFNDQEILAGPIPLDVEIGDVLGGIILDTIDPAVLDFEFLPQ